nr:lysoplasmalogenase family protein [Sphingomonas colocasiae]
MVALSIAFGLSYIPVLGLSWSSDIGTVWKGAGVALLAVAAAVEARGRDGWLLASMLALGALGDVLLEIAGLTAGALAFMAAHIVAITLYLANRRPALAPSQLILALAVVPLGTFIAWSLPADRAQAGGVGLYALFVAAMAGAAWASRFPRLRTGIGAMMFLVSDLLIFARMGAFEGAIWIGTAIWLLYYLGQLLIFLGVARSLTASIGG